MNIEATIKRRRQVAGWLLIAVGAIVLLGELAWGYYNSPISSSTIAPVCKDAVNWANIQTTPLGQELDGGIKTTDDGRLLELLRTLVKQNGVGVFAIPVELPAEQEIVGCRYFLFSGHTTSIAKGQPGFSMWVTPHKSLMDALDQKDELVPLDSRYGIRVETLKFSFP